MRTFVLVALLLMTFGCRTGRHAADAPASPADAPSRPNVLFAISDDQSWPHAGAYGAGFVETPAFDRTRRRLREQDLRETLIEGSGLR